MKIISIVGTRPQFLKLCPMSTEFNKYDDIQHIVIHSGQHYDSELSDELFKVLKIKEPDYMLTKKGNTSIDSLSNMMIEIEKILLIEKPNKVIVFGDCDTTIAGAIVAKKLKIYLVHIEAGMRSYNKDMPEEINRVLTDHISDLLLCSTKDSIEKLKKENISKNVYFVGNLQLDLLKYCCKNYNNKSILENNKLQENNFCLLTIHREYNTNKKMLAKIFTELENIKIKIVFPMHPRTKNIIKNENIIIPNNLLIIKPVNYLDMTILEKYCEYIITDSGGIQPEAWFLKKKCIIMRHETEWIEPLLNNNNILYDYKTPINTFIDAFLKKKIGPFDIIIDAPKKILKYINISKDIFINRSKIDNLNKKKYKINFFDYDDISNSFIGSKIVVCDFLSESKNNYKEKHHPLFIFNYSINCLYSYLQSGDKKFLNECVNSFDHNIKKAYQTKDVIVFYYTIEITVLLNINLNSDWCSCIAQGYALYISSKLYKITNDIKYLEICKKIYNSYYLEKNKKNKFFFTTIKNNYIWFQEYQHNKETYILNGFIYGILGLYEYYSLVYNYKLFNKNELNRLYKLLCSSLYSIENYAMLFINENWISSYCLYNINYTKLNYNKIHKRQFNQLYKITNEQIFKKISNLIKSNEENLFKILNKDRKLFKKSIPLNLLPSDNLQKLMLNFKNKKEKIKNIFYDT